MSEHAKIGEVGFALQSGEGVPASNPTYALGSMNGFPGPRQDLTIREPAGHRLVTQEIRKAGIHWEVASTMWAHAASVGSLIKGILPTESVGGSGPYSHAYTPGASDQFLTFFSTRGGPLYERFDDGLIESLIFDFAPSSRVAVTVQASGKTPRILGGAYTAGTRESDAADGDIFHFVGATIEFDWASSPATTARVIDFGSLRLTRPLTIVPTADAQGPLKLLRGSLAVETTMQLLLEDYDGYRATFMGGTGGSTPSPTIVQGSLELLFVSATTPTHTLKIEIPSIWWEWTPPEPAARPGALVVDLTGYAWRPSSGAFVTVTLTNGGASSGDETYEQTILNTSGLVSYWRLGEASGTNAADAKNGNPGTYYNAPTLGVTGAIAGDSDTAVDFNGSDEAVTIPLSDSLNLTGALTVEAWMRADSLSEYAMLFESYDGGDVYGYGLNLHVAGQLNLTVRGGGSHEENQSAAGLVTTGAWIHVVATYDDATDTVRFYKNGSQFGSDDACTQVLAASGTLLGKNCAIAARPGVPPSLLFFDGRLDEVAIYSRALTAAEVADHYAKGT